MDSVLTVVTPASNLALLPIAELRAAAGLTAQDKSRDTELRTLGLEAAEYIAGEICRVATAAGSTPTLLEEALSETIRLRRSLDSLILARRFVSDVVVTEGGDDPLADDGTEYLVQSEAGLLQRLSSDRATCWTCGTIVVTYTAGFATVPPAVKSVAGDYIRMRLAQRGRDPFIRSVSVEGVDSMSYRDAASGEADFAEAARRRLSRFVNYTFG